MKLISKKVIGAHTTLCLVESFGEVWSVELRGGKTHSIRNNATDKAMRRDSGRYNTLADFTEYQSQLMYELSAKS